SHLPHLPPLSPLLTPPPPLFFLFFSIIPRPPRSTLFPYTTLFRSSRDYARRRAYPASPAPLAVRIERGLLPMAGRRSEVFPLLRSEEHTSELQSLTNLVCRLLLEKKKNHTQRQGSAPVATTLSKLTLEELEIVRPRARWRACAVRSSSVPATQTVRRYRCTDRAAT